MRSAAVPTGDRAGRSRGSCRVTALLLGVGLLLSAAPVAAASRSAEREEALALRLLEEAAVSSRAQAYSGTKYVAAWRPDGSTTSLVDVRHEPRRGLIITTSPTVGDTEDAGMLLAAPSLDRALLRVLAGAYELRVAGPGRCTGREADVVEARRPAGGAVAGRFWLDRETGLLLRREVYDEQGRRVLSSAFVDLQMTPAVVGASPTVRGRADRGSPVSRSELESMREQGWHVPKELPGRFALFETRTRDHGEDGSREQVLHLAYSDGLSTTSLFAQPGDLGAEPPEGFVRREVGGHPVWAKDGSPERLVWAGGGRVWTLVSDAPDSAVAAAVETLPHEALPDTGARARIERGLSRLGSWLNPFG